MQSQQSFPTKWDLSPLLKSAKDSKLQQLRKDTKNAVTTFKNHWEENKEYLTKPEVLKQALDEYEKLVREYGFYDTEKYYFFLRSELEEENPDIKAHYNTIITLSKQLENDLAFFTHRISKIDSTKHTLFINSKELEPYKHFLELLFNTAKYLLSEDVEKVLNLKSKTSYMNWLMLTSGFLAKESDEIEMENGTKQLKTFEQIISLLNEKNKDIRDRAADSFNSILKKHIDVGEAELNSILENKKIDDDLRKIERPDVLRHIADDIDTQVVDTLIKTVSAKNTVTHKYYALKAKLLGLPKLAYHERNIEYGNINKTYSYQDSVNLVQDVFNTLDSEFASIFKSFVTEARVDVYPEKGKRGGAFCAHQLMIDPTYILLNHTDQLNDVLTLAHEAGHGINNELIKKKQNAINFGTPTSTAEVASTFMEDFVLQKLLETADDELRLSLMMTKLNSDISSIFRQIAAYEFEQSLHAEFRKQGYISKEQIGELFQEHMSAYMGNAVEQSEGSENWWIYWTHIRYFFYNYSYASGLLISKSLQASVKKDHAFIEKVKEFLSTGTAASPKDIFIKLGVDIQSKEFWLQGIHEIELLLEETTALAQKLNKI